LNGGCSNLCLPNPQSHQCFCPEGVQLKPGDAYTCQGGNYGFVATVLKGPGFLLIFVHFPRKMKMIILSVNYHFHEKETELRVVRFYNGKNGNSLLSSLSNSLFLMV